jgi:hypothetical protein
MGYRSDVTMVMYPSAGHKDKFAALKLYVDENLPDQFEVVGEGDGRYLYCYMDGVKWYDNYEEVRKIIAEWEDTFKDKDEPDTPLFHFEFMRVGENMDDVEYDCSSYADRVIHVNREVYINF